MTCPSFRPVGDSRCEMGVAARLAPLPGTALESPECVVLNLFALGPCVYHVVVRSRWETGSRTGVLGATLPIMPFTRD